MSHSYSALCGKSLPNRKTLLVQLKRFGIISSEKKYLGHHQHHSHFQIGSFLGFLNFIVNLRNKIQSLCDLPSIVVEESPVQNNRLVNCHPHPLTQVQVLLHLCHQPLILCLASLPRCLRKYQPHQIVINGDLGVLMLNVIVIGLIDLVLGEIDQELVSILPIDFEQSDLCIEMNTPTAARS